MDLVEFVTARLDEREALARAAGAQAFYAYREGGDDGWAVEGMDGSPGAIIGDQHLAHHIAASDPAHVLREVAAMRAIVELHSFDRPQRHECIDWGWRDPDDPDEPKRTMTGYSDDCPVLRLLALPDAEHPDYQPEWRPSATV